MSNPTTWVVLDQQPGHGAGYTRFSRFDVGLTPGVPAEWANDLFEQVSAHHPGIRPATAADFEERGMDVPAHLRPRRPRAEKKATPAAKPTKSKRAAKSKPAAKARPARRKPAPETPASEPAETEPQQ